MVPDLYPFQADLFQRLRAARGRGARRIVVQGATGSGKNILAAYVVRQAVLKGSTVLVMVHRRRLVDQISDRLNQFEVQHGILMRGERADSRHLVQVASRDTLLSRCVNNSWVDLPAAALVIVDEAHHAAKEDSEYRRILGNYQDATVLLLSATPVDPDGNGMGPWAEAIECAAPTSQLVKEGYLVPVKCYAPERRQHGKGVRRGIAGDLVASWQQYAEDSPTVLFTARVKHSKNAVAAFNEAGILAVHVDADTPDDVRDRAYDDVAARRVKVLSNVGIVGEGVDVPELRCCQLYLELGSRVRFLQACGRIMRPWPGKTHGILIDHSGAVFRHGFPDEDSEWTLDRNTNQTFREKHDAGETARALYCLHCALAYHGLPACPQCGRAPVTPPRSVFSPPPVKTTGEILTEAERDQQAQVYSHAEKVTHWWRCLGAALKRHGSYGMAAQIYKRKYGEWPERGFPMYPTGNWQSRVPQFETEVPT